MRPQIRLICDSGAFSAFTRGKPVSLSEYTDFVLKNQDVIDTTVNLDMINPQNPEVAAKEGGNMRCNTIHIESGREYPGKLRSMKNKTKIITQEEIQIEFNYPIKNPTTFSFKSKGGFTLKQFWKAVHTGYLVIYNDEEETAPVKESEISRGMIMNRPSTHGKYGVWGHDLGDLVLTGFDEVKPGVFHLSVES